MTWLVTGVLMLAYALVTWAIAKLMRGGGPG